MALWGKQKEISDGVDVAQDDVAKFRHGMGGLVKRAISPNRKLKLLSQT